MTYQLDDVTPDVLGQLTTANVDTLSVPMVEYDYDSG
jgi:hypothetical protein